MKTRRRIAIGFLFLAGIGAAIFFASCPREPVYQERRLSLWLEDLRAFPNTAGDSERHAKAEVAIGHIGTNAIPFLLSGLQKKDSPWKLRLAGWADNVSGGRLHFAPASTARQKAVAGFAALGQAAEPALVEISALIDADDAEITIDTLRALRGIDSERTLPLIIKALGSTNAETRIRAAATFAGKGSAAASAVSALLKTLDDSNPTVRRVAAGVLGEIAVEPEKVVPALLSKLGDPDVRVQSAAARALRFFGTNAIAALPELRKKLQSPDKSLRRAAALAIVRVQCETRDGAIVRGPEEEKQIALVFTGHDFAEGGNPILNELARHDAKASFFLTGDFLATPHFKSLSQRIVVEGHYLGPHSDRHLLYCSWEDRQKTLVTRAEFCADVTNNIQKVQKFLEESLPFNKEREELRKHTVEGQAVPPAGPPDPNWALNYFLPAFEHYNRQIADWTQALGATLISFTPGTRSAADYTEDDAKNFVSSQAIFDSIVKKEREDPHGLNGFLLLLHIGSGPRRTDKMHARFGELLDYLAAKGYQFVRVDELLEPTSEEGQNE